MSGFRPPIKKEIREEILKKVKEGVGIKEVADQYSISDRTIYGWLQQSATKEPGTLELVRLRKENQELYNLLGRATAELERSKKNRTH